MGTNKLAGKRKRQEFSEQEKFIHKSSVLLQREGKKIRAFEVRKLVQQLKQTRAQLAKAQQEQQALVKQHSPQSDDPKHAEQVGKKGKQVKKMQATVDKLEKEHAVLKALDLKAVVARAMDKTGLEKKKQQEQQKQLEKQMQHQRSGGGGEDAFSDDDSDDSGQRQLADGSDDESDDGFDSEDYENAKKGSTGDDSESDGGAAGDETRRVDEGEHAAVQQQPEEESKTPEKQVASSDVPVAEDPKTAPEAGAKQTSGLQLQNTLIDRILAHKQLKPLLDAIEKVLEKQEREEEKKLRKQEKQALKRDRNEVLIGGRSAAAPSSLFLGSLSGRGGVIDDDDMMMGGGVGMSNAYMDGADDDIAEFLGEKKKKNRMGQLARRQKAIRMEEAAKRKTDRENGVFRPFPRKDDAVSKYGPSERPKKSKKQAAEAQIKKKQSGGKPSDRRPQKELRRGERGAPSSAAAAGGGGSRGAIVNAPPQVEPSHPSWIAKQALKEKEKASLSAFSGKKITFGDD